MKKEEFWKLFNEKYKNHMQAVAVCDSPLGGDCGFWQISCYQNKDGIWCTEETIERCKYPQHIEHATEDNAFDYFLSMVHEHSKLTEWYIREEQRKLLS